MSMGEIEGRVNLDFCKKRLPKSSISGAEDSFPSYDMVMGPVTPLPDRENQAISSLSGRSDEADSGLGCQTPSGSTFDPFAPGPEELMLAPKKKMPKKTCPPIRRQLTFDSCCDSMECFRNNVLEESLEEESFLETVDKAFLDVAVPPRISSSEEIAVSDVSCPEGECGARREYTEGRECVDLFGSYMSELGSSLVGDDISSAVKKMAQQGPLTPIPDRQSIKVSSPTDHTDEGDLGSNCQTPRGSTFDPFATVPEGLLMFAPKKNFLMEAHVSVQRKLHFESSFDSKENVVDNVSEETSEEETFLAMVYKSLLDAIILCHVGECIGESSSADSASLDGLKTPISLPLLNGIEETCPGAPVRRTSKSRKFSINVCRKVEF